MSVPMLSSGVSGLDIGAAIENTPFPAVKKLATGLVNGTETQVSSIYFTDKILITITQGGRLSQWVRFNFENPELSI